jgi:NAD(P)-dependent dehydrogenase (short-subunit alcohol dehydrogenase family)
LSRDLKDKHFVIVGGSSGIGQGITRHLLDHSANVTVISRTWEHSDDLAGARHLAIDVTKDDVPAGELPAVIDGLAYCPGSIRLRSFRGLSLDAFREDFELNVVGAVKCIQAAMKGLRAADQSSLVLFSTVAVGLGLPLHASVAASKAGVEALARTLAAELSPKVRVNCIAPALVNTPLAEQFFGDPEKEKAMAARYPLQRTGKIEDVASMGYYLLTDGPWITGQTIGIDGGMSTIGK